MFGFVVKISTKNIVDEPRKSFLKYYDRQIKEAAGNLSITLAKSILVAMSNKESGCAIFLENLSFERNFFCIPPNPGVVIAWNKVGFFLFT